MKSIKRKIFVLRDYIKDTIEYPQGADAVPIEFEIVDYNIPENAKAMICVEKPSKKGIYNTAVIEDNVIKVEPVKQMFAEKGEVSLQAEVQINGKTLLTFIQPIKVSRSLIPIDSENGSNLFDELLKKTQAAIEEMEKTKEEIIKAAQEGKFSATVQAGDTRTLPAGEDARVTNTGTKKDAVFQFFIPRGAEGAVGPKGEQGIQGQMGPAGPPGKDGTAAVLNLDPGVFAMTVKAGHLFLIHNTAEPAPPLKIINGRLKYIIGEG